MQTTSKAPADRGGRVSSSRWSPAVFCLLLALPLVGWWAYGLFDLDEGFYAAVVAEMHRRGEWITPYYNGQPWFEKPILLYWIAKPCLALFGSEFGIRLPSVLATLATYLLVWRFTLRHLGFDAALSSVVVLASSLLVVALGRMVMTDALLVLFLSAALMSFWDSLVGSVRWRWLVGVCLGLAVLAKGPVALLLFGFVAAIALWRLPTLRAGFRGGWFFAFVAFCVAVASWYLPSYLQHGDVFVQEFLIDQNLGRFTGGDEAHTLPGVGGYLLGLPMYAAVLLIGMFPWSLAIPSTIRAEQGSRRDAEKPEDAEGAIQRFLLIWAATIFVFFTASAAKLPHYILPAAVPLAMLIGLHLAKTETGPALDVRVIRGLPWRAAPLLWLAGTFAVTQSGFAFWYLNSGFAEAHALTKWARAQGANFATFQLSRRERDRGTGSTRLQDTKLPSLVFYMDRTVPGVETLHDLLELPKPALIFTRAGRITPEDVSGAGFLGYSLYEARTPVRTDRYALWWLKRDVGRILRTPNQLQPRGRRMPGLLVPQP